MAYTRRPAQRKRNPVKKRVQIYGKAGSQLYKDVMYLKGLVNTEPKYHIVQSANNFSWAGIVVSLSSIPSGGGVTDRDGNSVLPRYLNINLAIGAVNSATLPTTIRMLVFRYWGESTGAGGSVTPSEILSTTGTQFAPFSHLNDDNTGSKGDRQRRIEILHSEFLIFDLVDKSQSVATYNYIMNQGEPKEHIKFNTSSTAEPVSGGLYFMAISDNNGVTTNSKYTLESKLTFYDN